MPDLPDADEPGRTTRGPGRPPKNGGAPSARDLRGRYTPGATQQDLLDCLKDIRTLLEHLAYAQSSAMVDKPAFLARYVYATSERALSREDDGAWEEDPVSLSEESGG